MQTGEWAETGKSVVRLVDSESVEVQVWVPVNSLEFVQVGSELPLQSNPLSAIGSVRIIVPVGDDRSRLYELRLSITGRAWPAGQTLRVAVPTANLRSVVAIHRDALVLRPIRYYRLSHTTRQQCRGSGRRNRYCGRRAHRGQWHQIR